MAITPKPFNVADKISRTVFRGKPYVFSAEDVNRNEEHKNYVVDTLSSEKGGVGTNPITISNTSYITGTNTLTSDINVPAFTFKYKGVEFDVPAASVAGKTSTVVGTDIPSIAVVLVASKILYNYATNAPLCTIEVNPYPGNVPSSDVWVWENESVQFLANGEAPILLPTEQVVAVLGYVGVGSKWTGLLLTDQGYDVFFYHNYFTLTEMYFSAIDVSGGGMQFTPSSLYGVTNTGDLNRDGSIYSVLTNYKKRIEYLDLHLKAAWVDLSADMSVINGTLSNHDSRLTALESTSNYSAISGVLYSNFTGTLHGRVIPRDHLHLVGTLNLTGTPIIALGPILSAFSVGLPTFSPFLPNYIFSGLTHFNVAVSGSASCIQVVTLAGNIFFYEHTLIGVIPANTAIYVDIKVPIL